MAENSDGTTVEHTFEISPIHFPEILVERFDVVVKRGEQHAVVFRYREFL